MHYFISSNFHTKGVIQKYTFLYYPFLKLYFIVNKRQVHTYTVHVRTTVMFVSLGIHAIYMVILFAIVIDY